MRFDAYRKESLQRHAQEVALDRVGRRTYVLRREPFTSGFPAFKELCVRIGVYAADDEFKPYSLQIRLDRTHCSYEVRLDELTPLELRQLAQIREDVDRWIAGDLEELPTSMPWEKDLWRP